MDEDYDELDSIPARKRRKICSSNDGNDSDDDPESVAMRQVLAEELDLEIALRQRLLNAVESRITWALLLQESLMKDANGEVTSESSTENFRNAAMNALDAIETPCHVLFSRESNLPRRSHLSVPQPKHRTRPTPPPKKAKLLFVRLASSTPTSPPMILKLACALPTCARTDFISLQGLLNHCRISHGLEFGTHDECVKRCAVVVSEDERERVIREGTEVLIDGGLPSIRRLFEIAVGGDGGLGIGIENTDSTPLSITHLTRTLGHHKDTPALALFLGRAPKKRCINTYTQDIDVDILTVPSESKPWRMVYTHRNKARPELDVTIDSTDGPTDPQPIPKSVVPAEATTSRFHMTARIVVADRSLYIASDRRTVLDEPIHTHRWALSISSPSYSLHITTFLKSATITFPTLPSSDPSSNLITNLTSATLQDPPFVFSGTTSTPFLAKLKIEWVGGEDGGNTPLDIDHWVELDQMKASTSQLGDEQVLDVELDKRTELMPARTEYEEFRWDRPQRTPSAAAAADVPEYVQRLNSLIPRFPLTQKEVKGRLPKASELPYRLVTTPTLLKGLVMGRRKAIEWGRAKAVRDAYQASLPSSPHTELVDLTTGDVYAWMEDEGMFPRPKQPAIKIIEKEEGKTANKVLLEEWCPACGFTYSQHPIKDVMKTEGRVKAEPSTSSPSFICGIVKKQSVKIPIVDVTGLLSRNSDLSVGHGHRASQLTLRPRELVAVSDPTTTIAIRSIIFPLPLSSFPTPHLTNLRKQEIETHLAPYALLSLLTKSVIKALVKGGLEVMRKEVLGLRKGKGNGNGKVRLLTPSLLMRGLEEGGGGERLSMLLGRVGVRMEMESALESEEREGWHGGTMRIKTEDE